MEASSRAFARSPKGTLREASRLQSTPATCRALKRVQGVAAGGRECELERRRPEGSPWPPRSSRPRPLAHLPHNDPKGVRVHRSRDERARAEELRRHVGDGARAFDVEDLVCVPQDLAGAGGDQVRIRSREGPSGRRRAAAGGGRGGGHSKPNTGRPCRQLIWSGTALGCRANAGRPPALLCWCPLDRSAHLGQAKV